MQMLTKNTFKMLGCIFGLFSVSNISNAKPLDTNKILKDLYDMTDVNKNLTYYNSALNSYASSAMSEKNASK